MALALVAAFVLGWLVRNLLHRLFDRKMRGVLSQVAQLCMQLVANEGDLDLLARLLQALTSHAAWRRPGWCSPVRQEVRELVVRLASVHDHGPSREVPQETSEIAKA